MKNRTDTIRLKKNGPRYTDIYIDMVSVGPFGKEYTETRLFETLLNKYAVSDKYMNETTKVQARNCGYNI